MLRSLIHNWRVNAAVVLGAAVATAVLCGALLVGDSVRGSLRQLTLDRLGGVDEALVLGRFFREDLADALQAHPLLAAAGSRVAPVVLLRGSTVHADSGTRAAEVAIHGVDARFAAVHGPEIDLDLERRAGEIFPPVLINARLARELGAVPGDSLILDFGLHSDLPRETLMGETDPTEVLGSLRVTVREVLDGTGPDRFGLVPSQQDPLNVFASLKALQRAVDQRGMANGLLVADGQGAPDLATALLETVGLEDLGILLRERGDDLSVETSEFVLDDETERIVADTASSLGAPFARIQAYLANAIRIGDRSVPYSAVAAIDVDADVSRFRPRLRGGGAAPELEADAILLNTWAADDLAANVGDTVEMDYFEVGPREELVTRTETFRVAGAVAMEGIAGDPTVTPDYPGIQGSDDMADWDPPFPVDLDKVRPRDEDYWDRHRATPKAFVSGETGRRLWSTRFGSTTSVRIAPIPGVSPDETRARVSAALLAALPPDSQGFTFQPVKQQGLRAAAGSTDFGQLFIAFSFFLILSAALLVGLLFTLGVERRAREIGLLLAVGYPLASVRRRLLGEGLVLAALGALLGVAAGIGYAWLLMAALRSVWVGAVGSSRLYLHAQPLTLPIGALISMVVVLAAVALSVRRLRKIPSPALLAGSVRTQSASGGRRIAPIVALVATALAAVLLTAAFVGGNTASPALAFGTGASLLVGGIAAFAAWCRRRSSSRSALSGITAMAARNSSWNPGRSVLSVSLVASAVFVIVTVAANRSELGAEIEARDSGTGGFRLIAESDVPVYQDLDRPEDRAELGFADAEQAAFEGVRTVPLRALPGDDASCLNLYRPEKPRVLGIPPELIRRGGFAFKKHVELPPGADSPWDLLEAGSDPDVVPTIADANSAQWILKVGLGDDIVLENESGRTIRLRLVALLDTSVLQSEVLIAESAFVRHFPSRGGYGQFLIEAPEERVATLVPLLERRLGPYGFDAQTTRERLAGYKIVEHTYLSTFQMLGGLGLLLGTVGLAVVLLRNVLERRGELATLRAFGFRRSRLGWLVLAENAFLLLVGVGLGAGAGLLAAAPRLATIHVGWASLIGTLLAVVAVGMLSSIVAVSGAIRVPLLHELKSER